MALPGAAVSLVPPTLERKGKVMEEGANGALPAPRAAAWEWNAPDTGHS